MQHRWKCCVYKIWVITLLCRHDWKEQLRALQLWTEQTWPPNFSDKTPLKQWWTSFLSSKTSEAKQQNVYRNGFELLSCRFKRNLTVISESIPEYYSFSKYKLLVGIVKPLAGARVYSEAGDEDFIMYKWYNSIRIIQCITYRSTICWDISIIKRHGVI